MENLAGRLEKEAGGEPIEVAVIGYMEGRAPWCRDEVEGSIPGEKLGRPFPWSEARPLLDYEYHTGFGGADCHAVAAYTATKVVCISNYDGSTSVFSLPRNPCNFYPPMPGGG